MRKIILTLILLTAGFFIEMSAKKGTIVLQGPALHEVLGVSANGKWACGVQNDNGLNRAYAWNLENNQIVYFGAKGEFSEAFGIANDGTVCGVFITTELADNGAPQESGGYWKEGKLYPLRDEKGKVIESIASAITPDGQYIGGTIIVNGKYLPCVWKNGILEKRLDSNNNSAGISAISDDGQILVGWYTNGNRCPCYWEPKLTELSDKKGYSSNAVSISPNKKYILAEDSDGRFIYDMQTKEISKIPLLSEDPWNYGTMQILDDATAVLWESQGGSILEAEGFIYHKDGTWKKMTDWLTENWNTSVPEGFSAPGIARFANGMKTLVALCIGGMDEYGQILYQPVGWISDQEVNIVRPNALVGRQVSATNNIMLNWTEPSANSQAVTGYRIYRNGEKLADVPADKVAYVDKTAGALKLNYELSALYGSDESEKLETTVTMKDSRYAAPATSISVYQSNYNNAVINWVQPNKGYDAAVRLHNDHFVLPFGSNTEKTYWAGVKFNSDLVSCYADNFILKAIELYFCENTAEMTLTVSTNGKEVLTQAIDQSKLKMGQNNIVKLNKDITLPTEGDVKVVIKVIQSTAAYPLGLAQDPSIEGGNLCSEDGTTWTTLDKMSEGEYPYNWMIGMLLDSNGNDEGEVLATRSIQSPKVTSYQVYRDAEKIAETDMETTPGTPLQYIDKNVEPGHHTYGVEAVYNYSLVSGLKNSNIIIQKRDLAKCAMPTNLKGMIKNEDKEVILNWEMPEQAEVGYTNWITQLGVGYVDITGWYYGVSYDSERMKPFAGFKITNINFWPLADATFTLHIYEGDSKIYAQDIDSYTLKKINTVKLDNPVTIQPYKKYMVAIQVADVEKNVKPLGVDISYPYTGGRLISEDGTYFTAPQLDVTGNFMISMDVEKITPGFNPGITYKVYTDGVPETETAVENTFTKSITDINKAITFHVAAIYPAGERKSESLIIDPSSIDPNEISVVKIYPNPATSFIKIEGNVSSVSLINAAGQEIYRDMNVNTIDVTSFAPGIYILISIIDGKTYTNKVQII